MKYKYRATRVRLLYQRSISFSAAHSSNGNCELFWNYWHFCHNKSLLTGLLPHTYTPPLVWYFAITLQPLSRAPPFSVGIYVKIDNYILDIDQTGDNTNLVEVFCVTLMKICIFNATIVTNLSLYMKIFIPYGVNENLTPNEHQNIFISFW